MPRRSSSRSMPRCAPMVAGSATSSRTLRARSDAASSTASVLGAVTVISSLLQLVREATQGASDVGGELAVGTASGAVAVADAVEELHDVLDDDGELLRRPAGLCGLVGGDGLDRVEHRDRQRLGTLAALDDAELDTHALLQGRDARGERVRVQEDVRARVLGDESEALVRVVEPDLASRHSPPRSDLGRPRHGTTRWRSLRSAPAYPLGASRIPRRAGAGVLCAPVDTEPPYAGACPRPCASSPPAPCPSRSATP